MKTKPIVPSEEWEQQQLVQWLDARGTKYTAIPNSIVSQAARIKHARSGLRPGLPDLLVVSKNRMIWVELKRCKPAQSKVSDAQKVWLLTLQNAGCAAQVCYGAEDAKKFILEQETLDPQSK